MQPSILRKNLNNLTERLPLLFKAVILTLLLGESRWKQSEKCQNHWALKAFSEWWVGSLGHKISLKKFSQKKAWRSHIWHLLSKLNPQYLSHEISTHHILAFPLTPMFQSCKEQTVLVWVLMSSVSLHLSQKLDVASGLQCWALMSTVTTQTYLDKLISWSWLLFFCVLWYANTSVFRN